jgi:hypothetical protein
VKEKKAYAMKACMPESRPPIYIDIDIPFNVSRTLSNGNQIGDNTELNEYCDSSKCK